VSCNTGFADLSLREHTDGCLCGFADLRSAVRRDFNNSENIGVAYETPLTLAALTLHHAVCSLLGSTCRSEITGMNVEAILRNRVALTVSNITNEP
jgi:hypothetical protein